MDRIMWSAALACAAGMAACATAAEDRAYEALEASAWRGSAPEGGGERAEGADAPGDLAALLAFAEARHPELRAAVHRWRAATRGIPAERKLPEPTLSYTGMISSVETRVGPQQHKLGLSQGIPWPGMLSRAADEAAARARVAERQVAAIRARIRRDVRVPWAARHYLKEAARILGEQRTLLGELEAAVRARLSVDQAGYAGLSQLTLRRAELGEQQQALEDAALALDARIRGAAGLPAGTPLPAVVAPADQTLSADEASLRAAVAGHPDLAVAAARTEEARYGVRRAAVSGLPDLALGVSWVLVGEGDVPSAEAGKDAVMATVGVKVPLWRGAYAAEESAAEARVAASEAQQDALLVKAQARLDVQLTRLATARRQRDLYGAQLIDQARIALEATITAFSANRASFDELTELARQLLRYELAAAAATRDQAQAIEEIRYLTGAEVTP